MWNAVAFGTDNDRNVIVQVTYDRVGRVTGRRDPRGSLTSYRYDRLGRRRLLSNPLNQQWLTAFADVIEGSGQIGQTTKSYPLGYAVTHETDRVGRLARVDYGAAASTPAVSFAYDLVGSRVRMDETGATGTVRTTHYAHDRLQRLMQVAFDSDGDGTTDQTVSYAYDGGGLRTRLTLPGEVSITYQYDAAGRLASLTDWDGQVTTFGYDQAGRQTLMARASGLTSRYRHDASGRLREIHHSGPWQVERMLQAYLYALDGRGNRTQAREVRRRATPTAVVTIAHDDGSVVYSGAWAAETAYHVTISVTAGLGVRLYLSADGQGQATLPIVVGVGPDHGRFDLYLDGTLWETHDGYAPTAGERTIDLPVRGASGEHLLQIRSRADRNPASSGNRLRFRQVSAQRLYDTRTIDYTYDGVSRLIEADYDNGERVYDYTYDLAGNRLQEALSGTGVTARTTDYEYNAANQINRTRVDAGAWTNFTYDSNGNLTSDGVNSYSWDRANRLLEVDNGTPNELTAYAYDGLNNRISQTIGTSSPVVTQYLLDTQPGLVKVIAAATASGTDRYIHAPHGIHAMQSHTGDWTYAVQDALGSVRAEVDNTLTILGVQHPDPYGNLFEQQGNIRLPFAYTGEMRDPIGLQYHRARNYNPAIGGWLSLDPFEGMMQRPLSLNGYAWVEGNVVNDAVGELLSLINGYNYVGANPVNRVDPTGMCPERNEPGLVNQADAQQCHALVGRLRQWNINIVWEETSLSGLTCLPETVQAVANQNQDIQQRWTTREVRAIFNAFEVFQGAYQKLGMASVYRWPLSDGISIEKRRYVGTSAADLTALGKHEYLSRRITMSALNWGEAEKTAYELNAQIRAWLVLHEFSHIFVKDRTPPNDNYENYATGTLPNAILREFGRVVPTGYATESEPERAIEVVTATLWNNGYGRIAGFDSGAGGRTAQIGETAQDRYGGTTFVLSNVRDIVDQGETLEQWIIANVILRNP